MAYPLKQYTSTEYGFLSPDVYDYISYDKIYLMPEITDGTAEWTIYLYEPDETFIEEITDYKIETGYRVLFASNFYYDDKTLIKRTTIVIADTENQVIFNQSYDPHDYNLSNFLIRNRAVIT